MTTQKMATKKMATKKLRTQKGINNRMKPLRVLLASSVIAFAIGWSQPPGLRSQLSESSLKSVTMTSTERNLLEEANRLRAAESALIQKKSESESNIANKTESKTASTEPEKAATEPQEKLALATPKEAAAVVMDNVTAKQTSAAELSKKLSGIEAAHAEQRRSLELQIATLEKRESKLKAQLNTLSDENAILKAQLSDTKSRTREELKQVDDLHVRLMIAETQVERLNKIIEQMEGSNPIKFQGKIKDTASYPADSNRMANPLYGLVKPERVHVRTAPGDSNTILTTLRQGTRVLIIGREGDWYRIRLSNGMNAWLKTKALTLENSATQVEMSPAAFPEAEPRLRDVDEEAMRLLDQLKLK